MSIDGQVIWYGEIVCEGNYFFPISINSHDYVLQKTKSINTIASLRTIINVNVKVICYDLKNVVPQCLRSIPENDYNNFSPLHTPTKEHDIIMDEKNRRKGIKSERSVSIPTKDTTYD